MNVVGKRSAFLPLKEVAWVVWLTRFSVRYNCRRCWSWSLDCIYAAADDPHPSISLKPKCKKLEEQGDNDHRLLGIPLSAHSPDALYLLEHLRAGNDTRSLQALRIIWRTMVTQSKVRLGDHRESTFTVTGGARPRKPAPCTSHDAWNLAPRHRNEFAQSNNFATRGSASKNGVAIGRTQRVLSKCAGAPYSILQPCLPMSTCLSGVDSVRGGVRSSMERGMKKPVLSQSVGIRWLAADVLSGVAESYPRPTSLLLQSVCNHKIQYIWVKVID
jgi:hypothetical protein